MVRERDQDQTEQERRKIIREERERHPKDREIGRREWGDHINEGDTEIGRGDAPLSPKPPEDE